MAAPGDCSPSRSVVSKIMTRSLGSRAGIGRDDGGGIVLAGRAHCRIPSCGQRRSRAGISMRCRLPDWQPRGPSALGRRSPERPSRIIRNLVGSGAGKEEGQAARAGKIARQGRRPRTNRQNVSARIHQLHQPTVAVAMDGMCYLNPIRAVIARGNIRTLTSPAGNFA